MPVESYITARREFIEKVLMGTALAVGLAPLLQALKLPEVRKVEGTRITIHFKRVEERKNKATESAFVEVDVEESGSGKTLKLYGIKGRFEDVINPSVVIIPGDKSNEVVAYAAPEEYITFKTNKKKAREILDEVIEKAEKNNYKRLKRLAEVLKEIWQDHE